MQSIQVSDSEKPQCPICHSILLNEAFKPANLRGFKEAALDLAGKPAIYFKRKNEAYNEADTLLIMIYDKLSPHGHKQACIVDIVFLLFYF